MTTFNPHPQLKGLDAHQLKDLQAAIPMQLKTLALRDIARIAFEHRCSLDDILEACRKHDEREEVINLGEAVDAACGEAHGHEPGDASPETTGPVTRPHLR